MQTGQDGPGLVKEPETLRSKHMSVLSLLVVKRGPHLGFLRFGPESQALSKPFLRSGKTCSPPESCIFSHLIFCLRPLPLGPVNICSPAGKLGCGSSEYSPTRRSHFSAALRLLSALRSSGQAERPRARLLEKAVFQPDKAADTYSPIPNPASEIAHGSNPHGM